MFSQGGPSFFTGRNGSDELSALLILIAILLWVVYPFFPWRWAQIGILILAGAAIVWSVVRMLSTNLTQRRAENERVKRFFSHFKKKEASSYKRVEDDERKREKEEKEEFKRAKREAKQREREDRKTHRYFECPSCKKRLRVPKGKGKIRITCPHCGEKFERRT